MKRASAESTSKQVSLLNSFATVRLRVNGLCAIMPRNQEINIPKPLLAKFRQLAANNTNSDTDQVYLAMIRATDSSIKVAKAKSRVKVLCALKKEGVGTSSTENLTKRLCTHQGHKMKERVRDEIIKMVMRERVNDAYTELRKIRSEDNKIWRQCKRDIVGETRRMYIHEWRIFISQMIKKLSHEAGKKVEFLMKKWKRTEIIPDMYEDIVIENNEDFPEEFSSAPRIYGDVVISECEKDALMLPPKFALYEDISVINCRIRIEDSMNQTRWKPIAGTVEIDMFNETEKKMNINNLRVTSLPYNPNVAIPGPLEEKEEIRIQAFKYGVMEAVKEMKGKRKVLGNLSKEEEEGLKSLKEKVKRGELICCVSDKSGRWTCDSVENYKRACMDELRDRDRTPEITLEMHQVGERELNSHAAALLRMMGLEEGPEGDRLRRAVQAKGTGLAPYYGLRKDHKPCDNTSKGPRVRPLCGAKECSTRRVSYLLCKVLEPLTKEEETNCSSTEELLSRIEEVNRARDADPRWIVGSLDVKSLYPSLDIEFCRVVVACAMLESDIQYQNLKWCEIALYLRYNMDIEDLEAEGLNEWCPRRRYDRRPPEFVCSGSDLDKDVRYEPWIFPNAIPDREVVRKMFCVAIGVMVEKVMKLHDFVIDGKIFRQKQGGAIGLDLTGVVADIFMGRWDRMMKSEMAKAEIEPIIYDRYKDDIDFVLEVGGEERETEICDERDKRVMERLKLIADGIHSSIEVEVDGGFNHKEGEGKGRVPMLDVEMWVGKSKDGKLKILHSHYMKEMASRLVIMERSAHGDNTKRNVIINEIGRVLRNCSPYLPWSEIADNVSYFVRRLAYSGYGKEFRYEVVRAAVGRYKQRLKEWESGGKMYGDNRTVEMKALDKREKKSNWYGKRYESVMFVQPTEGSELKRRVQLIAKRHKIKVKVIEKAGVTVKKALQRSDPFPKRVCGREGCVVCVFGKPGICRERGCVYELQCKGDGKKYIGQTGRSVSERVSEEVKQWADKVQASPLWKHDELCHQGQGFDLEVKVKDRNFGKPTRRLMTEGVRIENLRVENAMNGKKEWTYVQLNKVGKK